MLGFNLIWDGTEENEVGIDAKTGQVLIEIDPKYYRPTEVDFLIGDASKAKRKLEWKPQYDFKSLVEEMTYEDLKNLGANDKQVLLLRSKYNILDKTK